eukprot:16429896-Heterocapsa_arctica.AAC.1
MRLPERAEHTELFQGPGGPYPAEARGQAVCRKCGQRQRRLQRANTAFGDRFQLFMVDLGLLRLDESKI